MQITGGTLYAALQERNLFEDMTKAQCQNFVTNQRSVARNRAAKKRDAPAAKYTCAVCNSSLCCSACPDLSWNRPPGYCGCTSRRTIAPRPLFPSARASKQLVEYVIPGDLVTQHVQKGLSSRCFSRRQYHMIGAFRVFGSVMAIRGEMLPPSRNYLGKAEGARRTGAAKAARCDANPTAAVAAAELLGEELPPCGGSSSPQAPPETGSGLQVPSAGADVPQAPGIGSGGSGWQPPAGGGCSAQAASAGAGGVQKPPSGGSLQQVLGGGDSGGLQVPFTCSGSVRASSGRGGDAATLSTSASSVHLMLSSGGSLQAQIGGGSDSRAPTEGGSSP